MNHDEFAKSMSDADAELDPQFDALLDEAMSPFDVPGGVPADLSDRIVSATASHLPSVQHGDEGDDRDVAGRIGQSDASRVLVLRRIAAALILFAWLGAGFIAVSIVRDAKSNVSTLATVEQVIDHVGQSTPEAMAIEDDVNPIDSALDQLEVDIELAVSSTTNSWQELAEEFEAELDLLDLMESPEPGV